MDNTSVQERNIGFDVLKCICAFFVVTIHCKRLPGVAGEVLTAVNRTAVPIFFMITGFYYQKTVDSGRVKSQIIKILKLTCWASLFYFVFNGVLSLAAGRTASEYVGGYLSPKAVVKFLVLCASPFQGHLWYLSSILYVLVGLAFFGKKWDRKKLYWLIPVLLAGHLVMGKYPRLLLGRELPMSLVRNEVFVGLPFFLLGDYLRQKKETEVWTDKKGLLSVVGLFLVVTSILESRFLGARGLTTEVEQGVSTILLALTLFVFFMKISADLAILRLMSQIGRQYSTMIYIIHPAFLSVLALVLGDHLEEPFFRWLTPIMTFLVSYGLSVLYDKGKNVVLNRQPPNKIA